jgi:broad specificity phosphatase PhoE
VNDRLIVIRHGETVWNAEHRFTTRSDVPLSDVGIRQAETAAANLAATPIDRIYASPLQRALRTAETIAAAQAAPCPVEMDERLTEIDAGPFEGKTEEELAAGPLADAFQRWHSDAAPEFPEGTESFDRALERAAAFLDEQDGAEGTTLAVTHGSLARLMVSSYFLGGPPPLHRHLWLDNCRLAVVEWRGGVPKLTGFNLTQPED